MITAFEVRGKKIWRNTERDLEVVRSVLSGAELLK
jgi:hypothetical protein